MKHIWAKRMAAATICIKRSKVPILGSSCLTNKIDKLEQDWGDPQHL